MNTNNNTTDSKTSKKNALRNRILGIIIIIGVIALACFFIDQRKTTGGDVAHSVYNVACNLPLTGMFSAYGEPIQDGISLAIDDLKDVLKEGNVSIKYDFQDNKSTPKDANMAAFKQLQKPVDVYVGAIGPTMVPVAKILDEKDIPFFIWGYDEFWMNDYKNTYRTWINFKAEAYYYIEYIKKISPKKVYIIRPQTEGLEEQFTGRIIPFLKSAGIEYQMDIYDVSQNDFKNIVLKAKAYGPDLYIASGFDFHLVEMLKNFKLNNMITDGNVYCGMDLLDASKKLDKSIMEGLRVSAPLFLVENKKYQNWSARFQEKFNRLPYYTDAYAYDMAYVLAYAAIAKSKDETAHSLKTKIKDVKFDGITGNVYFREDRDLFYNMSTCVYRDGKLKKDE